MKFQDSAKHNISYPTLYKSTLYPGALALALPLLSLYLFFESYLFAPDLRFIFAYGDPDYGYLFNSLMIVDGSAPWHIDHPGTPVQLLGALMMMVRHAIAGKDPSLATDFFLHSELYHRDMVFLAFGVFFLSQWFCGWRLQRLGASPLSALLAQAAPFFLFDTVIYFRHVSPETWIGSLSMLLVPMIWGGHALAAGMLVGVIVTLKIYSLPLALVLLALPRPRDWLVAGTGATLMAVGISSVWWEHHVRFFNWLTLLGTRTGNYGTGPEGQPGVTTLAQNLSLLATPELRGLAWISAFLIPLTAFYTLKKRRGGAAWGPRFGPELLASFAILLFAVRHNPVPRYLLPLTAPLGLLFARTCVLPLLTRSLLSLTLAGIICAVYPDHIVNLRAGRDEISRQGYLVDTELHSKYPLCAYLFPNSVPVAPMALFSGHLATKLGPWAEELERLYPQYFFPPGLGGVLRSYSHEPRSEAAFEKAVAKFPCRVYIYDNPAVSVLAAPGPPLTLPESTHKPYLLDEDRPFLYLLYVETPGGKLTSTPFRDRPSHRVIRKR